MGCLKLPVQMHIYHIASTDAVVRSPNCGQALRAQSIYRFLECVSRRWLDHLAKIFSTLTPAESPSGYGHQYPAGERCRTHAWRKDVCS